MARGGTRQTVSMRGHRPVSMHTRARFRPNCCKETGADHAHQHDHSNPDMDDVVAQQHPTQRPQLWLAPTEVSASVCHPRTDEHSCGSIDSWCQLHICRDGSLEVFPGPGEVQQGPGASSSDYRSLPILQSACYPQPCHPASHHQSLHREVLHTQTATGRSAPAAGDRCTTTPSVVHLGQLTEYGTLLAACSLPAGSQPPGTSTIAGVLLLVHAQPAGSRLHSFHMPYSRAVWSNDRMASRLAW